jgi:hypothetical protein
VNTFSGSLKQYYFIELERSNQVSIRLIEIFVPIKNRRGPHPIRVYLLAESRGLHTHTNTHSSVQKRRGWCANEKINKKKKKERRKKKKRISFQSTNVTRTAYEVEPVGKTRMLVLLAYGHKLELDNNPHRTIRTVL